MKEVWSVYEYGPEGIERQQFHASKLGAYRAMRYWKIAQAEGDRFVRLQYGMDSDCALSLRRSGLCGIGMRKIEVLL